MLIRLSLLSLANGLRLPASSDKPRTSKQSDDAPNPAVFVSNYLPDDYAAAQNLSYVPPGAVPGWQQPSCCGWFGLRCRFLHQRRHNTLNSSVPHGRKDRLMLRIVYIFQRSMSPNLDPI